MVFYLRFGRYLPIAHIIAFVIPSVRFSIERRIPKGRVRVLSPEASTVESIYERSRSQYKAWSRLAHPRMSSLRPRLSLTYRASAVVSKCGSRRSGPERRTLRFRKSYRNTNWKLAGSDKPTVYGYSSWPVVLLLHIGMLKWRLRGRSSGGRRD